MSSSQRYVNDAVATADGPSLLVMLYDRLVLDLARAEEACQRQDVPAVHNNLVHAQEIIRVLRGTLRIDLWDGAERLYAIYGFLLDHLVAANVEKNADKVRECLSIVRPLQETWRKAAEIVATRAHAVA